MERRATRGRRDITVVASRSPTSATSRAGSSISPVPHGILQDPTLDPSRGWFSSRDAVSARRRRALAVDRHRPRRAHSPARLRAAGLDPALLQAQLAVQLKSALHVSVVVHLPGGRHRDVRRRRPEASETVRVSGGGTDWDRVVKFGIGVALALLAGLFFLAAGVGIRRNRRRAHERGRRAAASPTARR